MGNVFGSAWELYFHPDVTPHPSNEASFDPLYGFEKGRKPRVMIATEEQMSSAKLPLQDRDYCAHVLLEYRACRMDVAPWLYKCGHKKHEYLNCQYEDYLLRMKEYEREKRLLQRKKRIEAKAKREEMAE